MTNSSTSTSNHNGFEHTIKQAKKKARARKMRAVRRQAARIIHHPDGTRSIVRFTRAQCYEHQILIASFGTLVITGLLQTFSGLPAIGFFISLVGSIDTLRMIHHLAAVLLIVQTLYHLARMIENWIVWREKGPMWPSFQDILNGLQMIKFNLGLVKQRPEFDRYTIEEKIEYWAMMWGTPLMIVTGLVLWFPTVATQFLPGSTVPVALTFHRWEAELAALAILIWHGYNVLIKETNRSIFNGTMSEEEMAHSHPLELRRILAAYDLVQQMDSERTSQTEPARLPQPVGTAELSLEQRN
jgi:cytochrome b subunit of formate dehydrogenase